MRAGRLVGMITVDDVVHIISEEAGEDILRLSGAGEGDINEPIALTVRTRITWLIVNLGTAILAASVVGLFQGEDRAVRAARGADADRLGHGRQCRHADARGRRPRARHQPADQFEHGQDDPARIPDRRREWRDARRADRDRHVG